VTKLGSTIIVSKVELPFTKILDNRVTLAKSPDVAIQKWRQYRARANKDSSAEFSRVECLDDLINDIAEVVVVSKEA
jgi:hypothetical protein